MIQIAKIIADGNTDFGRIKVVVEGQEKVESIEANDEYMKDILKKGIKDAKGKMANGYHPEADTMLQAYALCLMFFIEDDISIEGDIGEIPYEPGVVY